jgi:predicted Rossmann fold nucleotide-binding protein DprA/Smf involved in DNA uptake
MRIRFVKELKAEEKIREFEEKYGTLENLEEYLKRRPEDVLAQIDLEDWRYLLEHPGAKVVEGEVKIATEVLLTKNELQILSTIKKEQPKSIRELAKKLGKDVKNVYNSVMELKELGIIGLEKGRKRSLKPRLKYNKIVVEI